ncbi:MAG: type II toxin-antitoxin system PemK/MazF family toxin [Actinomycetes bacterium]
MDGLSVVAGQIVWVTLDPTRGREQGGWRPCVVVSSADFSATISELAIVLPCTSRDRGWRNHIRLSGPIGLDRPTFAMTEQPRTISVQRIKAVVGSVDSACLAHLSRWIDVWIQAA